MKEKRNRVNQKLTEIENINLELQNLEGQVTRLEKTFYQTMMTKKWVPDTYQLKQEIDQNAPDEANMEVATWKEVEEPILVPRTPTIQEKNPT